MACVGVVELVDDTELAEVVAAVLVVLLDGLRIEVEDELAEVRQSVDRLPRLVDRLLTGMSESVSTAN